MIDDWHNRRVTVMGLGRFGGGVGVTRWLAQRGARVTVTDLADETRLATSLAEIRELDVDLHIGGHDERDFRDADVVVVNPAIPESSEWLARARNAGVPITTEINLFLERCPAPVIAVTGSVGKSTITAMIGHLLDACRDEDTDGRVWVGGNIGRSLLDALPRMAPRDVVVLELSSFQLQRTPTIGFRPHVAVITNITPNHLDWHGDFAAYRDAKLNIVRYMDPRADHVIVQDEAALQAAVQAARPDLASIWRFGLHDGVATITRPDGAHRHVRDLQLDVPGAHNRQNAAAALAVAEVLGVDSDDAVAALARFEALPHRLQRVGEFAGVTYYDDSKSTTPEAAITALDAMTQPVHIILGGYDKGSDLTPLARAVATRARFAAGIGTTGPRLVDAIRDAGGHAEDCGELSRAVSACQQRAQPGDAILLSPACASWDQFVDYRHRGAIFGQLAAGNANPTP
jgi:UDP-N-acetylmuramoylalanine--D-glutamate ligase